MIHKISKFYNLKSFTYRLLLNGIYYVFPNFSPKPLPLVPFSISLCYISAIISLNFPNCPYSPNSLTTMIYLCYICLGSYVLCLVAQSCPTLCDPTDCSSSGSSVRGSLQSRILEWAAVPSSRGPSRPRDETQVPRTAVGSLLSEPPGKPLGSSQSVNQCSWNGQPYRLRAIIFCGAWNHLYQGIPRGVRSMRAIKYGSSSTIRKWCYWRNHCIPIHRKRHTLKKENKDYAHWSHWLFFPV